MTKTGFIFLAIFSACTSNKSSETKLTPDQQKYKASNLAACDQGNAQSCYIVGFLEKQAGNIPEAKRYFKIACEKGNSTACNFLNVMK